MKTQTSGWEVAEVIGCTLAVIAGCIVAKLFVLAVVADIAGAPQGGDREARGSQDGGSSPHA